MRLTITDLLNRCIDGAGGDNSTSSQTFYKQRINTRYELVLSTLPSRYSETQHTLTTVSGNQYYDLPPNMRQIKEIMVTIGSMDYPLDPVFSYNEWRGINAIDFQGGAIPTRYFTREEDFGIWTIPRS